MNIKLKFRMLWVLAFMLATPWAVAQKDIPPYGFAGEDFCKVNPDPNVDVVVHLGLDEVYSNDESFYEWRLLEAPAESKHQPNSDNVFYDKHQHYATAWLDVEGDYVFSLQRMSKYGYQTENVTVSVRTRPEIVSVEALKKCYNTDDQVTRSQFKIETDPPDMEELVEIANPDEVMTKVTSVFRGSKSQIPVHFVIKKDAVDPNPVDSDKSCMITVSNQNTAFTMSVGFITLVDNIRKLQEAGRAAKKYVELLDNGKLPWDPIFDGGVDVKVYEKCCQDEEAAFLYLDAYLKFGVGLDLPIRIIPGVYAPIYAQIVGIVSLPGLEATMRQDGDFLARCGDIKVAGVLIVEGGAGIGIGDPAALGFDINLVLGGDIGAQYNITQGEWKFDGAHVYIIFRLRLRTILGDHVFDVVLLKYPS